MSNTFSYRFAAVVLSLGLFAVSSAGRSDDEQAAAVRSASGDREITFDSSRDQVIPQLVDGGGWKTTIILMNPSNKAIEADVWFYDDKGQGLKLPIAQLKNDRSSALTLTLAPLGSVTIDTADIDPTLSQGYAYVEAGSGSLLTGLAVFRQRVQGRPDFEAVVPIAPFDEVEFTMPFDNRNGFSTGLAIVNPDLPPAPTSTLAISFYDPQGKLIHSGAIPMAAGAHTAFSLPVQWPILDGKSGILIARSNGRQFASLGLRFAPGGAFTSFHALSLPPTSQAPPPPATVPPSLPGVSASCNALQGALIFAQDTANTYLGTISTDKYLSDSLANQYGTYGSTYSTKSILNRHGQFGSDYSSLSPFNQSGSQPPLIVIQGKAVAYLSLNPARVPRVDPYLVLQCVSRSR